MKSDSTFERVSGRRHRLATWTVAYALLPAAFAQPKVAPAPPPPEPKGYVELNAQSAFGNVTSQSFALGVGIRF